MCVMHLWSGGFNPDKKEKALQILLLGNVPICYHFLDVYDGNWRGDGSF